MLIYHRFKFTGSSSCWEYRETQAQSEIWPAA